MILSKKRITKALIRLRGCAGWSVPGLSANLRRQVFSRRGPFLITIFKQVNDQLSDLHKYPFYHDEDHIFTLYSVAIVPEFTFKYLKPWEMLYLLCSNFFN